MAQICYEHEALQQPTHQIRLLNLLPGDDHEDIHTEISTWNLGEAPAYNTISYTWGSPDDTSIVYVNEKPLQVRKNCHYAMWQVRLHAPGEYIWIDSICIDQRNHEERAQQVAIMGQIYALSSFVFSCIGAGPKKPNLLLFMSWLYTLLDESPRGTRLKAHKDQMEQLVQEFKHHFCHDFVDRWEDRRRYSKLHSELRWNSELHREDGPNPIELLAANGRSESLLVTQVETLCKLPYWRRLWVVPEMAIGINRGMLLLGSDVIFWDTLVLLTRIPARTNFGARSPIQDVIQLLVDIINNDSPQGRPRPYGMYSTSPVSLTMERAAKTFSTYECVDPRDRIYGLLPILSWPRGRSPPIPDYTQSAFDLAVHLTKFSETFDGWPHLLAGLGIHSESEQLQHLDLRRRSELAPAEPRVSLLIRSTDCFRLSQRDHGTFSVQLRKKGLDQHWKRSLNGALKSALAMRQDTHEDCEVSTNGDAPQELHGWSGLCGWVCADAREGDILVNLGSQVHLVLRNQDGGHFDVIGQAVILLDYGAPSLASFQSKDPPIYQADVEINLTAMDLILLACQDLPARYDDASVFRHLRAPSWFVSIDLDLKIDRLFTNPIESPHGCVTVSRKSVWWIVGC